MANGASGLSAFEILRGLPAPDWAAWLQAFGASAAILLSVTDVRRRNSVRRLEPLALQGRFAALLHRELASIRAYADEIGDRVRSLAERDGRACIAETGEIEELWDLLHRGVDQPMRGLLGLPLDAWHDTEIAVSFWSVCGRPLAFVEALDELLCTFEAPTEDEALRRSNLIALPGLLSDTMEEAWKPVFERCERVMVQAAAAGFDTSYLPNRLPGERLEWVPEFPDQDPRNRVMVLSKRYVSTSSAAPWWRILAPLRRHP